MTVLRNSLARCNARHLRIKRLVQFIFVGAVYHNALSNCAALLCRTQRRVAHMCSSTVSDTANRLRKTRKKKSSVVPPFRSGHMSAICARLGSKGKAGVQRGRKTAGCPSFLPPAAGAATLPPSADGESLAEVQRKTPRPLGANPLTQFVCPGQPVQRKEPPVRANTLTQFAHTAQPVLKKLPPGRGEPPARFRCPNRPVQRKRVPHTDTCPPVKTKYFYALHYKSDVL